MSKKHVIAVKPRSEFGKNAARRARHAGTIPATVYSKGQVGRNLVVDAAEWSVASRGAHLMTLVEDGRETSALIKEVQYNFLKHRCEHIDFLEVDMNVMVESEVAIRAVGEAIGTARGGMLEQHLYTVAINCKPGDIPEFISVDVSALNVGDSIHTGDMVLPAGIELACAADLMVFNVLQESGDAAEASAGAEPEVITEKKVEAK